MATCEAKLMLTPKKMTRLEVPGLSSFPRSQDEEYLLTAQSLTGDNVSHVEIGTSAILAQPF